MSLRARIRPVVAVCVLLLCLALIAGCHPHPRKPRKPYTPPPPESMVQPANHVPVLPA
jgi:hypothetical protein